MPDRIFRSTIVPWQDVTCPKCGTTHKAPFNCVGFRCPSCGHYWLAFALEGDYLGGRKTSQTRLLRKIRKCPHCGQSFPADTPDADMDSHVLDCQGRPGGS
jgi:ssDNA-binding Zn-finger/Zn-ribbon topoisomerase 1